MTFQTDQPIRHVSLNATNRPATFFVRSVETGDMLLDAPYQRGEVWTAEQQMGLIRSWLMGVPIPAIILNDRTSGWRDKRADADADWAYAVIDGKQRITAAIDWFTGELTVPASWFPPEHVEVTEATIFDGAYVRYTGLSRTGQRRCENYFLFPCAEGRLPTLADEAHVYLLVNGAGTPQTDADMDNARRVADS